MNARFLRLVNNVRYWSWPVEIEIGSKASLSGDPFDVRKYVRHVIAPTAREAGLWMRNQLPGIPCLSIVVFGPRGGKAWSCWRGWETTIAESMWSQESKVFKQLTFNMEDK